jgi:hypothetical protein
MNHLVPKIRADHTIASHLSTKFYLRKFETFANLNVEVISKIKKLEASVNTPKMAPKTSLSDIIKTIPLLLALTISN